MTDRSGSPLRIKPFCGRRASLSLALTSLVGTKIEMWRVHIFEREFIFDMGRIF